MLASTNRLFFPLPTLMTPKTNSHHSLMAEWTEEGFIPFLFTLCLYITVFSGIILAVCFSLHRRKLKDRKMNDLLNAKKLPGFPGVSVGKKLPAVQETRIWSLGWEDPLEKEMETHSCVLAWEIPWTEEPGGLQSLGFRHSLETRQQQEVTSKGQC